DLFVLGRVLDNFIVPLVVAEDSVLERVQTSGFKCFLDVLSDQAGVGAGGGPLGHHRILESVLHVAESRPGIQYGVVDGQDVLLGVAVGGDNRSSAEVGSVPALGGFAEGDGIVSGRGEAASEGECGGVAGVEEFDPVGGI